MVYCGIYWHGKKSEFGIHGSESGTIKDKNISEKNKKTNRCHITIRVNYLR
jgi:hypothetical protein